MDAAVQGPSAKARPARPLPRRRAEALAGLGRYQEALQELERALLAAEKKAVRSQLRDVRHRLLRTIEAADGRLAVAGGGP